MDSFTTPWPMDLYTPNTIPDMVSYMPEVNKKSDLMRGGADKASGIPTDSKKAPPSPKKPRWTKEEEAFLEENYLKMRNAELVRRLNKTKASIVNKLVWMGLRRREIEKPSKEELGKLYIDKRLTTLEIGEMIGVSWSTISKWLKSYNIPIRTLSESHKGQTPWNTGKQWSEETKRKLSIAKKGKHSSPDTEFKKGLIPWNKGTKIQTNTGRTHFKKGHVWDSEVARKRIMAMHIRPTKPEQKLIDLIEKYNLPYKYVGDGQVIIYGLNPDFINCNGEKKIIEVFSSYYHDSHRYKGLSWKQTEFGRKAVFSQLGYAILILWDYELNDEQAVLEKIRSWG